MRLLVELAISSPIIRSISSQNPLTAIRSPNPSLVLFVPEQDVSNPLLVQQPRIV